MKKAFIISIVIAAMQLCCINVNSSVNESTTVSRSVSQFNAISISVSADVIVTKGSSFDCKIEGMAADIEKVKTVVEKNRLIIKTEKDHNSYLKDMKIYITLPELCSIELAGSGNVESATEFTCNKFSMSVAGSGNAQMQIDAKNVDVDLAGSGNITLKGKALNSDISMAGSGNVSLTEIQLTNAEVSIAGSGNCKINVVEKLNASISGSGNVLYVKQPRSVKNNLSGNGAVKKLR